MQEHKLTRGCVHTLTGQNGNGSKRLSTQADMHARPPQTQYTQKRKGDGLNTHTQKFSKSSVTSHEHTRAHSASCPATDWLGENLVGTCMLLHPDQEESKKNRGTIEAPCPPPNVPTPSIYLEIRVVLEQEVLVQIGQQHHMQVV